jgi:hypothetical protein
MALRENFSELPLGEGVHLPAEWNPYSNVTTQHALSGRNLAQLYKRLQTDFYSHFYRLVKRSGE